MERRNDVVSPPGDLDGLVEWFDRVCSGLVLLDALPLLDVRAAVTALASAVTDHCAHPGGPGRPPARATVVWDRSLRELAADHERFRTSVQQLWWFYGIVEREDHGGNRQALGQYGRLVCEALRRHRAEERRVGGTGPSGRAAPPVPLPSEQR